MVLPDSSAEAERGFSVLTRLQKGARSVMDPQITDHLMRLRINGAKPIQDLKVYEYTMEVVKVMGNKRAVSDVAGKRATKSSRLF